MILNFVEGFNMDQIFSDCVEYKIFSEALLSKVSDNIFLVAEERSHARDVEEGVGKVTARKKKVCGRRW